MPLRFASLAVLSLIIAGPALAQNAPDPCAAFPWRLDKEKILISEAPGTTVYAGSYLHQDLPVGFRMLLRPMADVAFAHPPLGGVPSKGYGGVLKLGSPPAHGEWLVTLSDLAEVDILQGSGAVAPIDYAVAKKCTEVRESVKFYVASTQPLTLQVSGASQNSINVAVTPAWYFNARPPGER